MQLDINAAAARLQSRLGTGWTVSPEGAAKIVATWTGEPAEFERAKAPLVTGHYRGFDVEVRCQDQPTSAA